MPAFSTMYSAIIRVSRNLKVIFAIFVWTASTWWYETTIQFWYEKWQVSQIRTVDLSLQDSGIS
jgi:hypothetical protein